MRKMPIILALFLTLVWAYTCWYWYTCNIKWFCDSDATYSISQTVTVSSSEEDGNTAQEQSIEIETEADESTAVDDGINAPKLSAKDVLFDPLPKEIEAKDTIKEEIVSETADAKITSICDTPLVWPIVLWRENIKKEVEKLEAFLISIGEDLTIDRIYKSDDVEAVKRFQLKYKEDVLDPWDITTPTGYVWKTSIAKINEIACK